MDPNFRLRVLNNTNPSLRAAVAPAAPQSSVSIGPANPTPNITVGNDEVSVDPNATTSVSDPNSGNGFFDRISPDSTNPYTPSDLARGVGNVASSAFGPFAGGLTALITHDTGYGPDELIARTHQQNRQDMYNQAYWTSLYKQGKMSPAQYSRLMSSAGDTTTDKNTAYLQDYADKSKALGSAAQVASAPFVGLEEGAPEAATSVAAKFGATPEVADAVGTVAKYGSKFATGATLGAENEFSSNANPTAAGTAKQAAIGGTVAVGTSVIGKFLGNGIYALRGGDEGAINRLTSRIADSTDTAAISKQISKFLPNLDSSTVSQISDYLSQEKSPEAISAVLSELKSPTDAASATAASASTAPPSTGQETTAFNPSNPQQSQLPPGFHPDGAPDPVATLTEKVHEASSPEAFKQYVDGLSGEEKAAAESALNGLSPEAFYKETGGVVPSTDTPAITPAAEATAASVTLPPEDLEAIKAAGAVPPERPIPQTTIHLPGRGVFANLPAEQANVLADEVKNVKSDAGDIVHLSARTPALERNATEVSLDEIAKQSPNAKATLEATRVNTTPDLPPEDLAAIKAVGGQVPEAAQATAATETAPAAAAATPVAQAETEAERNARIEQTLNTTDLTQKTPPAERLKKFQNLFNPAPGEVGSGVQRDLRASIGDLNADKSLAWKDSQDAIDFFKKSSTGDNLNFMQRISTGQAQPTPELQAAADYFKSWFEQDAQLAASIDPKFTTIDNYFSQNGIWANPDAADQFVKQWNTPSLGGTPGALEHRTFPTIYDGLKAGLQLKEDNPQVIAINNRFQLMRAKMAQDFLQNQVAQGVDPEIAQKVVDRYMEPGIAGNQLFKDAKAASYALSNLQLGLSGFHLTGTSINSAISRFSNGLNDMLTGHLIQGAGHIISAPFAPVIDAFNGSALRNLAASGEENFYTQAAREANFNLMDQPEYRTSGLSRSIEQFQSGNAKEIAKGALATPFRAFSTMSKPLMEWFVPNLKAGAFQDAVDTAMNKLGPEATPEEIRSAVQEVANNIDNRFGKLQQDNLMWNKTLKDGMSLMMRSPGWNIGTVRELGGGAANLLRPSTYIDLATGHGIPNNTAYVASLVSGTMMMGAAINYAFTGEGPQSLVDYFFPRTGQTDPKGNPERVSLPTYAKDVVAFIHSPQQTVANKSNPLISLTSQVTSNKDYYGKAIRDTSASNVDQLGQVAKYIGTQAEPFSVSGGANRATPDVAARAENFMGLAKAPGYVSDAGGTGPANQVKDFQGNVIKDAKGKPVSVQFPKNATDVEKQAILDNKQKTALYDQYMRTQPGQVQALAKLDDTQLQSYVADGKITQAEYDNVKNIQKTAESQSVGNNYAVPKGVTSELGKAHFQHWNSMDAKDQQAWLDQPADQTSTAITQQVNQQRLKGLPEFQPSNRLAKLYADYEKDINTHNKGSQAYTPLDLRAKAEAFQSAATKLNYNPMVNDIYSNGGDSNVRTLVSKGQISKSDMDAAIQLDNQLYTAGLESSLKFSKTFRTTMGYATPTGGPASSSSSSGGSGSRGGTVNPNLTTLIRTPTSRAAPKFSAAMRQNTPSPVKFSAPPNTIPSKGGTRVMATPFRTTKLTTLRNSVAQ